jgi:hypothetical protein
MRVAASSVGLILLLALVASVRKVGDSADANLPERMIPRKAACHHEGVVSYSHAGVERLHHEGKA